MRALVGGYVEEHGRRLSAVVRAAAAAAADPADQREPRAPRPLCAQLLQALAAARDEAALLIDEQSTSGEPPALATLRPCCFGEVCQRGTLDSMGIDGPAHSSQHALGLRKHAFLSIFAHICLQGFVCPCAHHLDLPSAQCM